MDMKNPVDWFNTVTAIVTVASLVANFVAPGSRVGRTIHLLAFNLRKSKPE